MNSPRFKPGRGNTVRKFKRGGLKKRIRGDQVEETCNPPGDNSELAM
jgi:hypothetical protein